MLTRSKSRRLTEIEVEEGLDKTTNLIKLLKWILRTETRYGEGFERNTERLTRTGDSRCDLIAEGAKHWDSS